MGKYFEIIKVKKQQQFYATSWLKASVNSEKEKILQLQSKLGKEERKCFKKA